MTMRRVSETLCIDKENIFCRGCDAPIGTAGVAWKAGVAVRVTPLDQLRGMGAGISKKAVLREFSCPHCGRLLDTEVALPEDPFLDDIVVP
jgi:acetone carboxylase gamma subunit